MVWPRLAWLPGWLGDSHSALSSAVSISEPGRVGWWAPWPQIAVGNTNSLVFKDLSGGGCNFPHSPSKHVSRPCAQDQQLLPQRANHSAGGKRSGENGGPEPLLPSLNTVLFARERERERVTPWE